MLVGEPGSAVLSAKRLATVTKSRLLRNKKATYTVVSGFCEVASGAQTSLRMLLATGYDPRMVVAPEVRVSDGDPVEHLPEPRGFIIDAH